RGSNETNQSSGFRVTARACRYRPRTEYKTGKVKPRRQRRNDQRESAERESAKRKERIVEFLKHFLTCSNTPDPSNTMIIPICNIKITEKTVLYTSVSTNSTFTGPAWRG